MRDIQNAISYFNDIISSVDKNIILSRQNDEKAKKELKAISQSITKVLVYLEARLNEFDLPTRLEIQQYMANMFYEKGRIFLTLEMFAFANRTYSEAIMLASDSDKTKIYFDRGISYLCMELFKEAVADFSVVIDSVYFIEDKENIARAYYNRARIYFMLKDLDNARNDIKKAIDISPSNKEFINYSKFLDKDDSALLKEADKMYKESHNSQLSDIFQELGDNKNAHYYNALAIKFDCESYYEDAVYNYIKAISLAEDLPEDERASFLTSAYLNLGHCYGDIDENENAVKAYTEVIKLDSNNKKAYRNRAICNKGLGNFKEAIDDYNVVEALDSNDFDNIYGRGSTYFDIEDFDNAIKDFDKAISLNSSYAKAYNMKGQIFLELYGRNKNSGYIQNAIKNYNFAVQYDDTYGGHFLNSGLAYFTNNEFDVAISRFKSAIRLNNLDADAYFFMALAYNKLGNTSECEKNRLIALELEPMIMKRYGLA